MGTISSSPWRSRLKGEVESITGEIFIMYCAAAILHPRRVKPRGNAVSLWPAYCTWIILMSYRDSLYDQTLRRCPFAHLPLEPLLSTFTPPRNLLSLVACPPVLVAAIMVRDWCVTYRPPARRATQLLVGIRKCIRPWTAEELTRSRFHFSLDAFFFFLFLFANLIVWFRMCVWRCLWQIAAKRLTCVSAGRFELPWDVKRGKIEINAFNKQLWIVDKYVTARQLFPDSGKQNSIVSEIKSL